VAHLAAEPRRAAEGRLEHMRLPADIVPPERPPEVHEYRAALMSVFLHTLSRNNPARLVVPSLQPLMLSQAVEWIHRLPSGLRKKAQAHAAFRLAVAMYVEKRMAEFEPSLQVLLGVEDESALRARLQTLQEPSPDQVFQAIYEPLSRIPAPPPDGEAPKEPLSFAERQELPPEPQGSRGTVSSPTQQSQSTLDLENLTTTVRIRAPSLRDFKDLKRMLDPRSWDESPFWPESYQVELSEDGSQFDKVKAKETPGETWHGHLFEHVEWNWNTFSVSSFRNFLNISYEVSENPQRIRLGFSLYTCEGSTLFVREARNGVDVDSGFLNVDRVNTPPGFFSIDTQKVIRFSDILDRRSPLEGPVGSGQILSFMAPAIVGLWMHDLVSSLYFPSS
jgi:hypothetical protein